MLPSSFPEPVSSTAVGLAFLHGAFGYYFHPRFTHTLPIPVEMFNPLSLLSILLKIKF